MSVHPDPEFFVTLDRLRLKGSEWLLEINVARQSMLLFRFDESKPSRYVLDSNCSISSSRHGVGCEMDSLQTPLGLHRVAAKFGEGEPAGTVFKGRRVIGHVSRGMPDALITSRIFWLDGLEEGRNRGGRVDSRDRYIYIHGTADQSSIGRPASSGCIHVADQDLLSLFDRVPDGALVWIRER